jgi:hypothetical protein
MDTLWRCSHCGKLNSGNLTKCPGCNTPKESPPRRNSNIKQNSEKTEDNDKKNLVYEKPTCSQMRENGQACKYEPKYKCTKCGQLLCIEHANEFRSPNSGWKEFEGIFCPSCLPEVQLAHDQKVERVNQDKRNAECTKCGCECCSFMCEDLSKML